MRRFFVLSLSVSLCIFFAFSVVRGDAATSRKDTMTRQKISELSNHTIEFTTTDGVSSGETITLTFGGGFSVPGLLDVTDIDVSYGPSTGFENELTLASSPSGATWGVAFAGSVLTLTSGTGTIPSSSVIVFQIGTHATTATTGDQQITNPNTVGTHLISIAGTFGETGTIGVPIIDGDQATVEASLGPQMVFDLDIGTSPGDSSAPYNFNLGELGGGVVTSSLRVYIDLKTTAPGGAEVQVVGTNGGLYSSSQSHTITTSDGGVATALTSSAEGFGLCVLSTSVTSGTIQAVAPFNGSCASNEVGGITTSRRTIVDTNDAAAQGTDDQAAVFVIKASTTSSTPAASDYTETIDFFATGSY